MKVMILYNPIAGAGRAAAASQGMADQLRNAGHGVSLTPTRLQHATSWLDESLAGQQLLVVAGGDGAVRLAAAAAIRAQIPLYHLPLGTENLFAREFGMDRSPNTLLHAIDRGQVRHVDLGICNRQIFLLMASVGFDAEVVDDLARRRGASISHLTYVRPILNQLWRWRPAMLDILVDGQPMIPDNQSGFVVVANSRQYGWRLNPANRARMDDGLLDVVFFPARSRLTLAAWALRCRMRRQFNNHNLVFGRGREVLIACRTPLQHYQIDGDPPELAVERAEAAPASDTETLNHEGPLVQLSISVQPAALSVLVP